MLPFARWQAVSGLTLIARGCFPDWLLREGTAFLLRQLAGSGSVNKGSCLALQTRAVFRLNPGRCPGVMEDRSISEIKLLSVWLTGLDGTSASALHSLKKIILAGNAASLLRWTLEAFRLVYHSPCLLVRLGSWYRFFFPGSISWAAWGKRDQYFSFLTQGSYRPSETASSVGTERLSAPW